MRLLLNLLGFQVAWFACVVGAGRGEPWVGPVVTLVVLAAHMTWQVANRWAEIVLVAVGALFGFAADSALVVAGFLAFPEHARLGAPSTLWMIALWANFAATLNVALRRLEGRYRLAALLGAFGGPMAYYAGANLDALVLGEPMTLSLTAIALVWGVATPALVWLARQTRKWTCCALSPAEVRS